jgi:hypothetical protein
LRACALRKLGAEREREEYACDHFTSVTSNRPSRDADNQEFKVARAGVFECMNVAECTARRRLSGWRRFPADARRALAGDDVENSSHQHERRPVTPGGTPGGHIRPVGEKDSGSSTRWY